MLIMAVCRAEIALAFAIKIYVDGLRPYDFEWYNPVAGCDCVACCVLQVY
jgi:hypothetical protein